MRSRTLASSFAPCPFNIFSGAPRVQIVLYLGGMEIENFPDMTARNLSFRRHRNSLCSRADCSLALTIGHADKPDHRLTRTPAPPVSAHRTDTTSSG